MTNFEKWKDELKIMVAESKQIAIVNGKPVCCDDVIGCSGCYISSCDSTVQKEILRYTEWLLSEFKESYRLTKQEKAFCDYVETGYLVRNPTPTGELIWVYFKPKKIDGIWKSMTMPKTVPLGGEHFQFIKSTDTEPYCIEDMSEWEVEEEEA